MTINFKSRRRSSTDCPHNDTVRSEIAGMSREVCETCGHVSVGFVSDHLTQSSQIVAESTDD